MTTWDEMSAAAGEVRDLYDEINRRKLGRTWGLSDFVLGFTGDVGDLAKLVMAHQGHRADVAASTGAIGHELSDCLFSLMVIAQETGVDLAGRFTTDMATLAARLRPGQPSPATHPAPAEQGGPAMPPLPSLLAVLAHPDDESLLVGGTLTQHAASGARTAVVTATWAEDSHRAAELADALDILGAGAPRMLGYADARVPQSAPGRPRLCDAPVDHVVEDIVRHIRAVRPDIVLTHDAYGQLTGHPDHRQTHRATLLAIAASGLEHLYPDAGEPWQPAAVHMATHPHSAIADLGPLLSRVGKSVLSVPDTLADVTCDVRQWLDQKWAAITAHRSQVEGERPLPGILTRLPEDIRYRILGTEHYTSLTAPPRHPPAGSA